MTRPVQRALLPSLPVGLSPDAERAWRLSMAVFEALGCGDAHAALVPIAELEALMPGDARIAQYRKCAAVVGFEWQADRQPYVPETVRVPPPSQSIDLVAFHVDLPRSPSEVHDPVDYLDVLSDAFRAASTRAPRAHRILVTDEATPVPNSLPVDEVRRMALDPSRLMYERMRAQVEYLAVREADRCSVLMDVDVLVNRDPAAIFAEDFDIGLTYRLESKDAPFNGGVILAGPGQGAHAFLSQALACYDALADDVAIQSFHQVRLRAWWGDQFALYALVGPGPFWKRSDEGLLVNGCRVAFFPGSDYNVTYDGRSAPETLAQKHFIHFKGNRKALLARFAGFGG